MKYKVHEVTVSSAGIRAEVDYIPEENEVMCICGHCNKDNPTGDPISNKALMEWFDQMYREFFVSLSEKKQVQLVEYVDYLHEMQIPGFVKKMLLMQYMDTLKGVR
jgi:hypothetical protein